METKVTSKNTSINRDRVPAIYSKLAKQSVYGTNIFDVRCGKWIRHIEQFAKDNAMCTYWHGYDPYNQTRDHNDKVVEKAFNEYEKDFYSKDQEKALKATVKMTELMKKASEKINSEMRD